MTLGFLILLIILSAIASLATLIIGIIHLATGKKRSGLILGLSFVMSLIIFFLCIMEVVKRGTEKVKHGMEWLKGNTNINTNTNSYTYDWDEINKPDTTYSDTLAADSLKAKPAHPIK
jgi:cellulose synthase/poly-beta-1,6-N-acetylglucosamine synthase-like glycosyltransferase